MPLDILSCIVFISAVAFYFPFPPLNCTFDYHDVIISIVIIIRFYFFAARPRERANFAKLPFYSQISCELEAKQLSHCFQTVRSAQRHLYTR